MRRSRVAEQEGTYFTGDDKLRGMMQEASEQGWKDVASQCTPLLDMIQGRCVEPGQRITLVETLSAKVEGADRSGGHKRQDYSAVDFNCKQYSNALDPKHIARTDNNDGTVASRL